mmetsp:Transcript_10125/g.1501  ORF Transcript_10125/g.1501 Transcript_10125/m.1501 type:complete len:89 (+) Transcript_10125:131-397(+)
MNGADIEKPDENGNRAIHKACRVNDTAVLDLLVSYKVGIDVQNNREETPLAVAIRHRSVQVVYRLVEIGAKVRKDTVRLARETGMASL